MFLSWLITHFPLLILKEKVGYTLIYLQTFYETWLAWSSKQIPVSFASQVIKYTNNSRLIKTLQKKKKWCRWEHSATVNEQTQTGFEVSEFGYELLTEHEVSVHTKRLATLSFVSCVTHVINSIIQLICLFVCFFKVVFLRSSFFAFPYTLATRIWCDTLHLIHCFVFLSYFAARKIALQSLELQTYNCVEGVTFLWSVD